MEERAGPMTMGLEELEAMETVLEVLVLASSFCLTEYANRRSRPKIYFVIKVLFSESDHEELWSEFYAKANIYMGTIRNLTN